ncbi:MAG: DUF4144 family protein [Chromatiales bacterium]|jgi:hypothetical protein
MTLIHWPAIIKHGDDPELTYIGNQSVWERDTEQHSIDYDDSDLLIDSAGNIFTLSNRDNDRAAQEATGTVMALEEILGLVKAHASQAGSCCVAKLYAPSIADAFEIVRSF